MTTKKAPNPNEPLWTVTDVVATIALTARNVHVTVLPLKPAVPKEYLYALEEALCVSSGAMWRDILGAAGVHLNIELGKPTMVPDHEGQRQVDKTEGKE